MATPLAGLTKAVLAGLLLLSLAAQAFVIPASTLGVTIRFPETAPLVAPGIAWGVVVVACVQAILVITWRLVSLVARDRIFSDVAFWWVRGMIVASIILGLLALGAIVALNLAAINPPGVMLALTAMALLALAFCLIITTMLGLLRRATSLTNELRDVI